jgi:hypothetical protein
VAPSPGHSTLLGGSADPSRPADLRDPFPIYTLLRNAGLSESDTLQVGGLLMRRIRARLAKKALADGPAARAAYLTDHNVRKRINEMIVAEEIAKIDFTQYELRSLERSLQLGLVEKPKKGPMIARTAGPGGPETFEILELPTSDDPRTTLKSRKDGRVHRH